MKNIKIRAVADAGIGAALCVLLIVISMYVPVISGVATLFCGMPLMYVGCKNGLGYGIMAAICSIVGAFVLTANVIAPCLLILMYGMPAALFGVAAKNNFKFLHSYILVLLFVFVGVIISFMMINGDGHGIESMLNQAAGELESGFNAIISQSPEMTNFDIASTLAAAMEQTVNMILFYLPTIAITLSMGIAYIIVMSGVFFLKRLRIKKDVNYIKFNMIRVPKIVVIMIGVIFLIISVTDSDSVYVAALQNILLISTIAVGVSGFSHLDYLLAKKIKLGYIRALIYIGVLVVGSVLVPFITEFCFILGVFDAFTKKRATDTRGDDNIEG